jgi:hypothetical protein
VQLLVSHGLGPGREIDHSQLELAVDNGAWRPWVPALWIPQVQISDSRRKAEHWQDASFSKMLAEVLLS